MFVSLCLDFVQVEKTCELTEKTKTKASSVEVQARAVAGVAKGAARASERQQAALGKAKTSAQAVSSAGEKARLAFRWEEQGNLVIWHVFKTRPVLVGASLGGISAMLAEGEVDREIFRSIVLVDIVPRMDQDGAANVIGFMRNALRRASPAWRKPRISLPSTLDGRDARMSAG